ncbi:copper amine oxidase N-terminal domain-containing protein [Paenibacillus sp. BR2-3]|uniref:copper amine oxidase N-terminal domain-containing protein n=1 Tax=Paenibacillus sp. BR2-3 TaxID=3048494 RepID=UPI0039776F8F
MRKLKVHTKWFASFIALLLILAGCQAVGGLDVNKALLGDLDVKSSESSMSLSLKAVPAPGISAEDKKIVDLINSFSLNVSRVKLQDNGNISAQGTVVFKQLNVPFTLFLDKEALVFTVEGAKQPFYFPIADYGTLLGEEPIDQAKTQEISKLLAQFVVNNLPNPSDISVSPVTEAVYGQQVNLTKLHAEFTGDQLPGLLKSFLRSVSKDTEGFTKLIEGLYDYLLPVLQSNSDSFVDPFNLGLGDMIPLEDKEGVVTVLHDAVKLAVDTVLLVYDKQLDKLYESTPELRTVLSKETKLQTDIFVDSDLHVRKQNVELNVALPASDDLPLQSISFKAQSESWNINGPVTADPISKNGALDLTSIQLTPGETLRNFNVNSNAYRILKEDIGITKKSIVIAPDDEYYYPIVKGNTTFVPLRNLAQDLDAKVTWNKGTRQTVVTDDLNGKKMLFKVGSKEAVINGTKVKLGQPVFVDEYGSTYVPLRLLAQALQATVKIDSEGWIFVDRK